MKFLEDDVNLIQLLKLILMYVIVVWGACKVMEVISLLKIIANQ